MSTSDSSEGTRRVGGPPPGQDGTFLAGYATSWALVIGINYRHAANTSLPVLRNAVSDAKAIAETLKTTYRFDQVRTLIEEQATYAAIRRELFVTLRTETRPDDRVLIFFAGHGEAEPTPFRSADAEARGYLIPYDDDGSLTRRLDMEELRTAWQLIPAKHVLCIVDACYSGLASRVRSQLQAGEGSEATRHWARQIITAGSDNETIDDDGQVDGRKSGKSYLATYMIEALQGKANDNLNAVTLYEYLSSSIKSASNGKQNPTYGTYSPDITKGVFLLQPPDVQIRAETQRHLASGDSNRLGVAIAALDQQVDEQQQLEQAGEREQGSTEILRRLAATELLTLLRDSTVDSVKMGAARVLGKLLGASPKLQEEHLASLVALLGDPDLVRVAQAAAALNYVVTAPGTGEAGDVQQKVIGGDKTRELIEQALSRPEIRPDLIPELLLVLIRFFPTAALEWLRLYLADAQSPEPVQLLALSTLVSRGAAIDVLLIHQAMERRPFNESYQRQAIDCLRQIAERLGSTLVGPSREKTIDLLMRSARGHPLAKARAESLGTLFRLDPGRRQPFLDLIAAAASLDPSPEVRLVALEGDALRALPAERQAPLLVSALRDPEAAVRQRAADRLNGILRDPEQAARPRAAEPGVGAAGSLSDQIDLVELGGTLRREPALAIRATLCGVLGALWQRHILELRAELRAVAERAAPPPPAAEVAGAPPPPAAEVAGAPAAEVAGAPAAEVAGAPAAEVAGAPAPSAAEVAGAPAPSAAGNTAPVSEIERFARQRLALQQPLGGALVGNPVTLRLQRLIQRVDETRELLRLVLAEGLEVRGPAAVALGSSGDLGALDVILAYVRESVALQRAITQLGSVGGPPGELAPLFVSRPIFPELIDAFRLLLASLVGDLDEERWKDLVKGVGEMLRAAAVTGDPAFVPLIEGQIAQPPDTIEIAPGTPSASGGLYLLAIQALGALPAGAALPLADQSLKQSLARQHDHGPALIALAASLVRLGGPGAITLLVHLLEADAPEVRRAAAAALANLVLFEVEPNTLELLTRREVAEADPETKQILADVLADLQDEP